MNDLIRLCLEYGKNHSADSPEVIETSLRSISAQLESLSNTFAYELHLFLLGVKQT